MERTAGPEILTFALKWDIIRDHLLDVHSVLDFIGGMLANSHKSRLTKLIQCLELMAFSEN
jgi:hypothetical protein